MEAVIAKRIRGGITLPVSLVIANVRIKIAHPWIPPAIAVGHMEAAAIVPANNVAHVNIAINPVPAICFLDQAFLRGVMESTAQAARLLYDPIVKKQLGF